MAYNEANKLSCTFHEKESSNKSSTASDAPDACNRKDGPGPCCNATTQFAVTPVQQSRIHETTCLDPISSYPSFDLGIDMSHNADQFVTPQANVFAIIPPTSPVPYQQSSLPHIKMLSSSKQVTPESLAKENAYNLIIDYVDVTEVEFNTNNKVTYLLPVDANFVKLSLPEPLPNVATWKDCPRHPVPDSDSIELVYLWCNNTSTDDENRQWVVHGLPRLLIVYGNELKDNLLGSMAIIPDVIDTLIRRFNQLDAANQRTQSSLRWRHFFESSFSMLSISAMAPHKCQSVLNQFINHHHCIAHCTMLVIPLLVDDWWCAYMLNLNSIEVHVLNPLHTTKRHGLHQIFFKIHESLAKCIEQIFDG